METFNNVLTERDDLLQILKENNVPKPSKGVPGMIIQAYLVLARLFDLDLLEPLSHRGDFNPFLDQPSQLEVEDHESSEITTVKLEPTDETETVFTENIRFSDESDQEPDEDKFEAMDFDDFLSDDDFLSEFAPSKKKRKYTNNNYDEKLQQLTDEQTSVLEEAFKKCVCLTGSVEKELIEKTALDAGLIGAWYRSRRKNLPPKEKEKAKNEMIKLRAQEMASCPVCLAAK